MHSSPEQQHVSIVPDVAVLTTWRKSSYSGGSSGDCLEANDSYPAHVPVRDSKNPHGPALVFPAPAWTSFIVAVKKSDLGCSAED